MKKIKWGILGAGNIAHVLAKSIIETQNAELIAVASRNLKKGKLFAKKYSIPRVYNNYEELLNDTDINIVYIATPHPMHAEWAIKTADSGKHILCEKPITINAPDAMTVIEAARRNKVFLMEAFMYRTHPQTKKIYDLVKSGAIGEVRIIESAFSFNSNYNPDSRIFNPALGGGGIMDIGCYTISFSRLIAGAALGKNWVNPVEIKSLGHIRNDSKVDTWATALLRFENDILAYCVCGVESRHQNCAAIYGTKGIIIIPNPWTPTSHEVKKYSFTLVSENGKATIITESAPNVFTCETSVVTESIQQGLLEAPHPAMSWEDTLGNMQTLDRWRESLSLTFPTETEEAYKYTLDHKPLKVRPNSRMKYGEIKGLDAKISKLVMGVVNPGNIAYATAMFDDFFARGGNTFDTAYIYAGGSAEKLLGKWIENRNIRKDVIVIDKGAHTPHCFPDILLKQFEESLERLRTDYVDIYFMHRDNPDIPVGEFVEVLNQLQAKRKLKIFGGSNWTIKRIIEANEWAKRNKKQGFSAISNNFSLARMINPVWEGCIASSEPAFREWHEKTQFPLFAWSSQAQGFFVPGRTSPEKKDNSSMVHAWYSPDNFERQERCFALAKKKNVHPNTIVLAYVLNQLFPVFALIGPMSINEILPSIDALDIVLTSDEIAWLDLRK